MKIQFAIQQKQETLREDGVVYGFVGGMVLDAEDEFENAPPQQAFVRVGFRKWAEHSVGDVIVLTEAVPDSAASDVVPLKRAAVKKPTPPPGVGA